MTFMYRVNAEGNVFFNPEPELNDNREKLDKMIRRGETFQTENWSNIKFYDK